MNTDSAGKGRKTSRMGEPEAQPPTSPGRNFFQRIILFIISVPAIFVLVSLAPENGHWPLNITLILISIPCAFEASRLFAMNPHKTARRTFGIVVNSIAYPVVSFLWVLNVIETRLLLPAYMALVMSVMFVQVFNQQHTLHKISRNIGKHLAIIAYPSLFIAHLIMISKIPGASQLYIVLLLGVILNDTMA
ncbi:MAG: phosphatidate cytidylyltransferase, partial [Salinispira sp.]